MPVEVEILVAPETAELLLFPAQMPLHLVQRLHRIHHRKAAVPLHPLDVLEQRNQLVPVEIHQPAVAETQVAALQRRQRITERAARETHRLQKIRQLLVILDQPARRDARRRLDAHRLEILVRPLDLAAHIRQPTVLLMLRHIMRIDRHDHAGQPGVGQLAHVRLVPQPAVGADHRVNSLLRRIPHHRPQIPMHHRLAPDEQQIADVIAHADVDHILRLRERHASARLRIKLRAREPAKPAVRIANIRDRKLEIPRPAMLQDLAEQAEQPLLRADYRLGKIRRPARRSSGRRGGRGG